MKKLSSYIIALEKVGIIREQVDLQKPSLKHQETILSTLLWVNTFSIYIHTYISTLLHIASLLAQRLIKRISS